MTYVSSLYRIELNISPVTKGEMYPVKTSLLIRLMKLLHALVFSSFHRIPRKMQLSTKKLFFGMLCRLSMQYI
ncbi:hypothetical protein ANME2D_02435 [Candidatus Methanoperedens nitroreducens]|uniref:Uncharacterized protein n=1 Tax=Candidatus Methanoperedens nitratireducens TaxID=1392998 RepID=A0A062V502_9EURY|nr:hypothetical protein ANME2D_02435 [Candidatus Methanoperedens nitroreducens]